MDAAEEPPAKVARLGDALDVKASVELEKDAKADKRKVVTEIVAFDPRDTTLNFVATHQGRMLMALSDGGLQYFVAAGRGNVGIKSGRYMFEVKVLEMLSPAELGRRAPLAAHPKHQLRLGFSTFGSSLFLGDSEDGVCFDSEGLYHADGQKNLASQRFSRDQILAVLLNVDPSSPNKHTVSLFRDGARISEPQPLPEALRGKTLYPHVAFRNVSLQVHFGPEPLMPLPFRCRSLQAAAAEDVVVAKASRPKNGKFQVLFPVAAPDEATFDWLDTFLEQNPDYTELSDRKIVDWAMKSGVWPPKPQPKHSNDKPDLSFGIQSLDDLAARNILQTVAPLVPRNYVVMEVRSNLLQADRKALMSRFSPAVYERTAKVVLGEPPEDMKEKAHVALLAEKQERLEGEWKASQAEKERKRQLAEKQKALSEQRKLWEAQRKVAEKANEAEEVKKEEVKKEEEETKKEVKEEEMEEQKADDDEKEPPKAELSEEEKATAWFVPHAVKDLSEAAMAASFAEFTIPDEIEGFDKIEYAWLDAEKSQAYLQKWIGERKKLIRVEDLQISDWFYVQLADWQRLLADWQMKQNVFKADAAKRAAAILREQKEKLYHLRKAGGSDVMKTEGGDEAAEAEAEAAADIEDGFTPLDILTVEDVTDVGSGEPLFGNFQFEDWSLMTLRFELHLLIRSFNIDIGDPSRFGIHVSNILFYYTKYYRKPLHPKMFGVSTEQELVDLVLDTVYLSSENLLVSTFPEEILPAMFVKLTEAARVDRNRRIDLGDDSARLKFTAITQAQFAAQTAATMAAGGSKGQIVTSKGYAAGAWQGDLSFGKGAAAAAAWRPQIFRPTAPAKGTPVVAPGTRWVPQSATSGW